MPKAEMDVLSRTKNSGRSAIGRAAAWKLISEPI